MFGELSYGGGGLSDGHGVLTLGGDGGVIDEPEDSEDSEDIGA